MRSDARARPAAGGVSRLIARVGQLPAVPVVAAVYAAAVVVGSTFDEDVSAPLGLGLVVPLIAYCAARPAGGLGVFLTAALPSAGSVSLADFVAVDRRWLWLALVPIALVLVAHEDRRSRPDRPESSGAG